MARNLDGAANERALIRLAGLGRRRAAPQEDLDRKLHRLVDLFAFWGAGHPCQRAQLVLADQHVEKQDGEPKGIVLVDASRC